ncbi:MULTISPECIES: tyrosine-type recombinase/integrase [Halanaerobium]|jgi:integrase/recombinase XerD|uniref:Integrase/recombinase XerD n=2 Tax=Halanaerobium TaxID=2330 RepID=A0A1G6QK50_9FIRM|nr:MULTISPECIES: tyrosine-type recombinase/integrase [Halanaerobium]TDP89658.1 integrase/recombinase XerD [Halanaerobium saccharolyticum]SDC92045.1 integrase/recombinase XerD [Halanaerobium congolense]
MLMNECLEKFEKHLKFNEKSKWTITGYLNEMEYFSKYLETKYNGPVYVEDITKDELKGYLNYIRENGYKASSRNRVLFVFRSFYNFTQEEHITDEHLAKDLKPIKTRKKERVYLTAEEVAELVDKIDHQIVKTAVQTMYYSGLRVSECTNLTFDDLDLKNQVLHVRQGKGNRDRDVPICDELLEILTDYLKNIRPNISSNYVFATKRSGELSGAYINRKLKEAVEELNWNKMVTAHVLRHSFASTLVKNDINIYKIQKLLGHSNISVTSLYAHSNIDDLSEAVNVL